MEYTINKLAKISGVTTRTLRYYEQLGLLCPSRITSNNYRIYGQKEVDLLQQILFYRELGVPLQDIKEILCQPSFDREKALSAHLSALQLKMEQIKALIENVTKTIGELKGENTMSDNEKFQGFKQKLIDDNQAAYGKEVTEKYGEAAVNASNNKLMGMSQAQWDRTQELSAEINQTLKAALLQGDPSSELAQKVCDLHRQLLCMFWADGIYSKEAHENIAQMYCDDERFKEYYEAIAPGATEFLRDAIKLYTN